MDKELENGLSEETQEKSDKKKAKTDRKPTSVKKAKKTPFKFFKDAKSEFKKVSWPTFGQTVNNTTVVLITIVGAMLAIWGLDSLFLAVLRFAFKMN